MSTTQIDKYATALANGYTPGQAETLAKWSLRDFMAFMSDVIRFDGGDRVWVTMDGKVQKEPKAGLERKN